MPDLPDFDVRVHELLRLNMSVDDTYSKAYQHLLRTTRLAEHRGTVLEPEVYNAICSYLQHPTRTGIWRLQGTWLPSEGLSKTILAELAPQIEGDEAIELQYGKQKINVRLKQKKEEIYDRVTNKISFILELFKYMRVVETQSHQLEDIASPDYTYIYEALDLDRLRTTFKEAYDYFVTHIDTTSLDTSVKTHRLTRIKGGGFLLAGGVEKGTCKCFAISPDVLEHLQQFLTLVGKIDSPQLRLIFSPEEEVFEPYFPFVKLTYRRFDPDSRLRGLYERAFNEYETQRYESCINAVGVIAEDYLTQIYETLLRDVAPKGLTLGQVYDALNNDVRALYKKQPPPPANLDDIYKELTGAMKEAGADPAGDVSRLLALVRTVVNALKAERTCTAAAIKELQLREKPSQLCVFPRYLRANITELIRNRNAAAHKTRIPLGNYEALRTMYSLVSVVMWWQAELALINWRADKEAIIDNLVKKQPE